MSGRYSVTVLCAMTIVGLLGCQSGPRWAWWKDSGTPPTDTSLLARTAVDSASIPTPGTDPTAVVGSDSSELASSLVAPSAVQETGLPSAQATPQTIAASAGPTQSRPTAVVQASSSELVPPGSANTIARAPLANYTPPGTPPPLAPSAAPLASSAAPPSASSVASVAVPTGPAPKLAGPYDPAVYQAARDPQAAVAASGSAPGRYPMATSNDRNATNAGSPAGFTGRYAAPLAGGVTPGTSVPQQASQTNIDAAGSPLATVPAPRQAPYSQMNTGPSSGGPINTGYPTNSVGDRYAALPPATGPAAYPGGPPPTIASQGVPVQAGNGATVPFGQSKQTAEAIHQGVPQMSSIATTKVTKPAGQYRPGGTSTFPSEQVELARRQAPTGRVGGSQAEGGAVPSTLFPGDTPERPANAPATRTY
jgi:hypothetical protein